ncbi:Cation-transporting ATPase V [Bifidobacterium animalis subsp. animalis IM386]|uniref:Cation-transporting ATPase V n=1 Tax=Bifidobacterium animalis subsp. animalis IM386 TaxID=1402194 RepID=A0AAV2W122_9BIFI|nr:heavy metal translocating P-type ATPase [Bifidobacterium animalis]AFI62330.1 cation-transporting ATPase V [Bifidobacterium animalis subsp. animalis ATCC 25527]AYN22969.1 cation-transporting ATPase V [Bifidobacterium animalis subsp. animalis]KFI41974.1 cation-transporting ATPase V [Bifidobacterium animalis subsp. animalis]CDI67153.1 Cation-transporting ATPase V [Bifidobacterium animalis subsp. animalis IM386]
MKKIIDLCKEVPLLPLTILAAIPLALIPQWRPWGHIHPAFDPGVGEWIIILFVAWTIYTSIREMIESIRHGHVGVDLLAIVALISTVCVQQYWASWAVVLMVASGEAIESYAQNKARGNLTALIKAAPQQAHVVTLPGTTDGGDTEMTEEGFRKVQQAVEQAQREGKPINMGNGHFDTVPVNDVNLGSVLIVLPGEIVPVDGQLLSGTASVDLSNINGEPVPRTLFAGAKVLSGSINGSTTMMLRTTSLAADSQYQQILKLVSSAEESRAAVVRTADMLAVPFTIISFAIAIVAWIVSGTGLRFAQVLVLATPCPLLIAAPVAYVAGTARLAKQKILIKSQDVLENLGRVTHVFFDKTGTLTVKQPQVVRVEKAKDMPANISEDEILMLAGMVEGFSVHVLAKGIVAAGKEAMARLHRLPSSSGKTANDGNLNTGQRELPNPNENYPVVGNVTETPGKGVTGTVDGHKVEVGRFAFVTEQSIASQEVHTAQEEARNEKAMEQADRDAAKLWPTKLEPDEMATYIAIDGKLAARIVLRDVPRYDAKQAIAELRELGVKEETMLTGDKKASAMIIANEVGITDVRYELLPQDKVNAVREAAAAEKTGRKSGWERFLAKLLGEPIHRDVTMMVGDGVNDSPVLAVADIGMAMTDGTSTAASESAEVVIMNDDIGAVPLGVKIARQTKQRMLQAVLIGIALAIVGMVCAAFNLIPVVVGAFLQEAIDVVSILWALTALFNRK